MKKKKGKSKILGMFFVAIVCFFIVQRVINSAPGAVDRVVSYAVFPFLQLQRLVIEPITYLCAEWKRRIDVDALYQAVVKERDDLQADLLALQATQKFEEETAEVCAFKEQYHNPDAILGRVLMRQSGNGGNFLLIDVGSAREVHKDTAVVYKNYLVGKVVEVYPSYSKVIVISDPNCKVAAYCDKTATQGIYQGAGLNQDGVLTRVGHLSNVCDGDTVFSSGEGVIFPRGFGIGTIRSFVKNEGDMQYTIAVTPFLDFSTVDYCYVLKKEMAVACL